MLTTDERLRLGDRAINVSTLHEYEVTDMSYGTPWLRRVNDQNELTGVPIRYDEGKHKKALS